jgi:hypothetical protein
MLSKTEKELRPLGRADVDIAPERSKSFARQVSLRA